MKNHLFLPCLLLSFLFIQPAANAAVKKRYSPCKILHPSDTLVEWDCYRLKGRETLENLFGEPRRRESPPRDDGIQKCLEETVNNLPTTQ